LLGIEAINGSLFNKQGNCPSHGFVEIGGVDARKLIGPDVFVGVDFDNVRLIAHQSGGFCQGGITQLDYWYGWNGKKKRKQSQEEK
jgi:hypothetical protein